MFSLGYFPSLWVSLLPVVRANRAAANTGSPFAHQRGGLEYFVHDFKSQFATKVQLHKVPQKINVLAERRGGGGKMRRQAARVSSWKASRVGSAHRVAGSFAVGTYLN